MCGISLTETDENKGADFTNVGILKAKSDVKSDEQGRM